MPDNEFKYDISVVIPIYNASKWLRGTIESVLSSSFDKSRLQLVLVDGGSDDASSDICREYAEKYTDVNITLLRSSALGVSAARNAGIKSSLGRYIMFLDADDILHENAVKLIVRFFDMHYEQTDAVVCHYININPDGTAAADIKVYKKILPNSAVYPLDCTMFYSDYSLAVIKNERDNTVLFNEKLTWREDMEHLLRAAEKKGTVGYIKEANYYKISRSDSKREELREDKLLSEAIKDTLTAISADRDTLSCAASAQIMHALNSHLKDDSLWPHQYSPEKYAEYEEAIGAVIAKVPSFVILTHPELDKYNRSYWIRKKPNADILITLQRGKIELSADGTVFERRKNVEWTLRRIRSRGTKVTVYGDFKLAAFDFVPLEEVTFLARLNGAKFEKTVVKPSFSSYASSSRIVTNNMWAFQLTVDASEISTLEMFVKIRGISYNALIVNCSNTVFNSTNALSSATVGNVLVSQSEKRILKFKPLTNAEVVQRRQTVTELFSFDANACRIREKCAELIGRRIWMYNDNFAMMDNGYYQFLHDVKINDGIERYYVIKNRDAESYINADSELRAHFVEYGSQEHILYFLCAERIFTAFTSGLEWRAIQYNEMYKYWDIFNAEVVLLSHGVLNQYWPWSFSPLRMCIDKVVISTFTEFRAWCENGFWQKDLIPSGMPRYSVIKQDPEKPPKRKILLALSWRMYLAGKHEILLDAATSRIALDKKYLNSSYFKNLMEFINSKELEKLLTDNDLELDVNLHPQFNLIYRSHMDITNQRVAVTDGHAELSDYMMMISDVSSIIFDFAVYKRPIMYFIPDIEEFKAGRNHFREVIIPFEDGLGPAAYTPQTAVEELKKIVENDFEPSDKYRLRLMHHHIPLDDCCGKLYESCIKEDEDVEITGKSPETINEFMDSVLIRHDGAVPILKSIYDRIGIPYTLMLKSGLDRQQTDLKAYFEQVLNERYAVCFAVSDTASRYWRDFIDRSGLKLKLRPAWRYSYIAVIDGGKIIYENCEKAALFYNWEESATGASFSIFSRYYDPYEFPRTYAVISVNGYNYSVNRRGLNVVVYDKKTKAVCDSFSIDLYADEKTKIERM